MMSSLWTCDCSVHKDTSTGSVLKRSASPYVFVVIDLWEGQAIEKGQFVEQPISNHMPRAQGLKKQLYHCSCARSIVDSM